MIFKIPSSTTDQIHYVDVLHNTCTCHSFTHSHKDCKHIKFVHAENEAGTLSLGKITRDRKSVV